MLLKNSAGNKSASFTMAMIAFSVVTLWLLVSIVSKIGHIEIRPFSGSEAMAYLTPILALYWGRRWQEDNIAAKSTTDASKKSESEKSDSEG